MTLSVTVCTHSGWTLFKALTFVVGLCSNTLADILMAECARCVTYYPLSLLIKKKSLFMCPLIFINSQLQMAFLPFLVSLERYVTSETCLLSFRLFCTDWDCPFPHVYFILAVVANTQEFRGIINASKLQACHAEHEGQYCFPHWDCSVSSGTLAIWSSCYQKSQYLHFVEYACPPVFEKKGYLVSVLVWLSCLHSQDTICKSSNDSKTTLYWSYFIIRINSLLF